MTARLHSERVIAAGAEPGRWLAMTHGIYGSGGNWRSIARRIVEQRPEWGAILVDLRGHGRSDMGPPPHTIAACADDLLACLEEHARDGARVGAIAGHSFGGKVALALRARAAGLAASLAQTWVLDSTPSARPGLWARPDYDVRRVWDAMRELPRVWPRRDAFVDALLERGHTRPLAQWLAMNVEPDAGGGVRLRLDLDQIEQLISDYCAIDLWPAVEDPALPGETRHVIAERSDTVSPADRARLAAEPAERRVHAHVIAGAGHWLHIDAPVAVVELLVGALPR